MADLLFLVGMMGAGKSTVGRLVAARLGWDFADTDADVVSATGMAVDELFETEGEPGFRAEERRALAAAAARPAPTVVSVGGGAVLDEDNRATMRSGRAVVWLRAAPEVLAARVGGGSGRPLLAAGGPGGERAELERLAAARRQWYEEVATAVVDVDELTPEEAATAVVAAAGVA